jgi:hypothetical protein
MRLGAPGDLTVAIAVAPNPAQTPAPSSVSTTRPS